VDGADNVRAAARRVMKEGADLRNYRGLKPAGSSGQSATPRHDPCGLINPILLTQFLSNLKDEASLLN